MIERGFHWSSRAWYAKINGKTDPEVTFGLYSTEGGTTGEMTMHWHQLGGKWAARLEAFDDSWKALGSFPELITELEKQDGKGMTDDVFVTILMQLGFKDLTNYVDPDLRNIKTCPTCGQEIIRGGKS